LANISRSYEEIKRFLFSVHSMYNVLKATTTVARHM